MDATCDQRLGRSYDRAAWFYETSAAIFSGGKIRASKKYAVRQLAAGERALFLGVGSGEDALLAAANGVQVTCVDLSSKMLERLSQKLKARGLQAEILCQNAYDHSREGYYDAVVANYFLNVFRKADMQRMLRHASSLTRVGGKFLIADVAPSQGNWMARTFNVVYLKLAMVTYWLLGLVPLHRNYDYRESFTESQLVVDHTRYFRFLRYGPILFQTIVARRVAN